MVNLPGHSHISEKIRAAGSRRSSVATNSNRSSVDGANMGGNEDDEMAVEPEQGNVLSHIISQLRPGADLSRVTLPTFILEPRSMLERITNFMAHPETLLPMSTIDDPTERFISVVKFYLSGWHIRPAGVKKPLNPILGETYTCYWEYPDNTRGYYISEQTSHHPPKSSYFFMAPEHHIRIDGTLKPRSKFLGNSVASEMEGIAVLRILNKGKRDPEGKKLGGEKYILTQPDMYARGILFGKMRYELGKTVIVQCSELDLVANIEFKTKGWVGGTYNAIGGTIKRESTGEVLYEFSGTWSEQMYITDARTKQRTLLYDATAQKPTPPQVRPLEEQSERESQKLWYPTVQAVIARDHEKATEEKSQIENMQREEAAKRLADGVDWKPRYFRAVECGPKGREEGEGVEKLDWVLNRDINGQTPDEQVKQILSIAPILRDQDYHERMPIPPSRHSRQSMESLRSEKSHARQISESDAPVAPIAATNSFNAAQTQQAQMPTIPQAQNEGDLIDYGNVGQNDTTHRPVPRDIETPRPIQSPVQAEGYIHTQEPAPVQQPAPLHPAQVQAPLQEVQPPINALNPAPPSNIRVTPQGSAVPVPEDLAHAQTANGGQAQKELEEQLRASESTPKPHAGALKDFHNEMRENLPGGKPPMQREESAASTDSSDFVDAKSTFSDDTVR